MQSTRIQSVVSRPLLPTWASVAITLFASVGVMSLVWHLAEQNRILREGQSQASRAAPTPRTPAVGDRLPSIRLQTADGQTATIAGLLSDGGVVAFLTTTCPFCEASISPWGALAATLRDEGIPFVAISLDELETTRSFAAKHGIEWSLWTVADSSSIRELRVSAVPLTAIISANATITRAWRGQVRSDDVESILLAVSAAGDG